MAATTGGVKSCGGSTVPGIYEGGGAWHARGRDIILLWLTRTGNKGRCVWAAHVLGKVYRQHEYKWDCLNPSSAC